MGLRLSAEWSIEPSPVHPFTSLVFTVLEADLRRWRLDHPVSGSSPNPP